MDCLERKTFPREDYRELVELILFFSVEMLKEVSAFGMLVLIIIQGGWQKPFILQKYSFYLILLNLMMKK